MISSAHPAEDDREGWIRVKLHAGLRLDAAEEAYLASLPPTDALRRCPAVPRKDGMGSC